MEMRTLWGKAVKWGAVLGLLAALVAGGLLFARAIPSANADAFTGCHGVQLASAQDNASGYSLTVAVAAQFGNGGEFGTAYCGSMRTVATLSVPAAGAGGTLTVTLVGDTTGSVSNTFTFPAASRTSGYTFTESSPSAGPKCAFGTATFTATTGLTLSAITTSVCPSTKK
jgi:hypothetical protein